MNTPIIKPPPAEEKPGKVVSKCPVCGHKVRVGDKIVLSSTMELMILPYKAREPTPFYPEIRCMGCGVKYLGTEELRVLKQLLERGERRIITLQ